MPSPRPAPTRSSMPWQRSMLLVIAVTLLGGGLWGTLGGGFESVPESTRRAVCAAMIRIGLVLGAIVLAWDSLKRPARWLPPGLAAIGVGGIVVVAAQPRLVLALVPLFGVLVFAGTIVSVFRRK